MDHDSDAEIPDPSNGNGKRRYEGADSAKVRLVPGPEREDFDDAVQREAFHKERALLAKQQRKDLAHTNEKLQAQLQDARKMQVTHAAHVDALVAELRAKSNALTAMQEQEAQMEAQFMGDQTKINEMYAHCSQLTPQLVDAQQILTERNREVFRLNTLLMEQKEEALRLNNLLATVLQVQQKDDALQLRSNALRGKKPSQNNAPPRRGTRASLDPARNSSTRLINIPLDPVPIPKVPRKSNPLPKAKLAATPAFAELLGTDVPTLASMIERLERLFVGDDVTMEVAKKTPHTPKKRGKHKQQKSWAEDKDLMRHIHKLLRASCYSLFGVDQSSDFSVYIPANAADVVRCEDGEVDPAEGIHQLDFSPGFTRSRWNDKMAERVVTDALETDDGRILEAGVSRDDLEILVLEKFVRYRAGWKGYQPRFIERLGRMETKREATTRGTQAFQQHQLGSRSNSAKHRKYEDRTETILATIEMKEDSGNARDIETWKRLLEIVVHLGEHGMSSEEESEVEVDNAKVVIYRIKICIWREPRIVEFLRFVDAQTALFKKHQ
ncbi:hypothetical protein C8J57DRAFT_1528459 [Mycena rebaudengoi]|nr:hypothetical protein C8J57DRAFT_1528459 [Mycena rebaudengoi]